jgi:hypothetical protein
MKQQEFRNYFDRVFKRAVHPERCAPPKDEDGLDVVGRRMRDSDDPKKREERAAEAQAKEDRIARERQAQYERDSAGKVSHSTLAKIAIAAGWDW